MSLLTVLTNHMQAAVTQMFDQERKCEQKNEGKGTRNEETLTAEKQHGQVRCNILAGKYGRHPCAYCRHYVRKGAIPVSHNYILTNPSFITECPNLEICYPDREFLWVCSPLPCICSDGALKLTMTTSSLIHYSHIILSFNTM